MITHTLVPRLSPLFLALGTCLLLSTQSAGAQTEPKFVIDAGVTGNEPTSIGDIEDCVEVETGDQFQMDVLIEDVSDLLAWELFIDYDPAVVTLVNQDVKLFLQSTEGSSVLDFSGAVPDESGFHSVNAIDSSDPPATDTGSGTLARITFEAVGDGQSPIRFGERDINSDGKIDRAMLLRDSEAEPIGDEDGDNFFDGETTDASVAVGGACPAGSVVADTFTLSTTPVPTATPEPKDDNDDSSFPWAIVAGAVVAGIVIAGGATTLLMRRRKSPGAPS